MKLILTLSSSEPHSDSPDCALIDISPEQAKALLALHEMAIGFVDAAAALGLASKFLPLQVGVGELLPDFRALDVGRENFPDGEDFIVAGTDFHEEELSNEVRCELLSVRIAREGVSYRATAKHSDELLTTARLDVETLRAIAAGKIPGIEDSMTAALGSR